MVSLRSIFKLGDFHFILKTRIVVCIKLFYAELNEAKRIMYNNVRIGVKIAGTTKSSQVS